MPTPITEDEKGKIIEKITQLYMKHGFDNITMDEVARQTKISKATIYKYFKSKEEIVKVIMQERLCHLDSVDLKTGSEIDDILSNFSTVYLKAILAASSDSSRFFEDMSFKFPMLYNEYNAALQKIYNRFIDFYNGIKQNDYCRDVDIYLVLKQLKMTLPVIINSEYIIERQTTITIVIREYYKLFLHQLLRDEYTSKIEEESTYEFVETAVNLIKKLSI